MKNQDLVKQAKLQHKESLKNKAAYLEKRDSFVWQMLNSKTPSWGSIRLQLVNW